MNSSSKKTLLILAASHYQCAAIRTAQRLGWRVVTTDNRPDNPGHRLADRAYGVDTTDAAGVLAIAREERIAGILAPCTDVAMPTAAAVAQALNLPGPSVAATTAACDKIRFRQFLARHHFATPKFLPLSVERDSSGIWTGGNVGNGSEMGRWILKPSQSSGSKGIVVVESEAEFQAALPTARAHSKSGEVVLEQFLEGHQGTLEGWLSNGEIAWHCLLDRQTAPFPHAATHGHETPSRLNSEQKAAVLATVTRIWRKLGVHDGPFDCDFVVVDNTVYLLEVSPRLGGNAICELIRSAFGFDFLEYTVRWACGETPGELPGLLPAPRAVILLGTLTAGRLSFNQEEAARLAGEPWVESLFWDVPAGTQVQPFIDGRHRVGQALIAAPDRATLRERVREVRRRLEVSAG